MRVELNIPDKDIEKLLWAIDAHRDSSAESLDYIDCIETYDAVVPVPLDGEKDTRCIYERAHGCADTMQSVLNQLSDHVKDIQRTL